ncbi:spermidine/putrescine ABC transporter ATP-binding protein [Brevibacillus choshinensis]|uniref:Spermidine/putrescine ABC transporter ATP-binding protein n=1 Tax=Brevibacillus choshinensis TaxID=54911 RepID=A0ABR5NCI9_BRECH|nr:ABC transporter ATP-binding protein [Brevibacillus choshinensis]KQL49094.1 spermidine/putrescine ABC transporter ATP-binding protein [Brevibacillus choshinensis]
MNQIPSTPAKIELGHVTHLYLSATRAFMAVRDINLRVEEGEFICLVGPSGCGKTTLLSLMAGLEQPTAGKVWIDGKAVTGTSRQVGYMLQQDYLFNWRTIEDNVFLGLDIQGIRTKENEEYAIHLLEEMELIEVRKSSPTQLSGGMRQRVALVRTLACQPDVLLLDEPFSALDYQTKLKLEDLIFTTLRRHKKTAVLVTHDLSESIAMGDRVYILSRNPGRINSEVIIPSHIRDAIPFDARNETGFQDLFHRVWKEMEVVSDAAKGN